jgi:hypothetical protein
VKKGNAKTVSLPAKKNLSTQTLAPRQILPALVAPSPTISIPIVAAPLNTILKNKPKQNTTTKRAALVLNTSGNTTNHATDALVTHPDAKKSLTLGILSLVLFLIPPVSILLAVAGTIYGVLALKEINDEPQKYKGKNRAIWGITLSVGYFFIFFGALCVLAISVIG